MYYEDQLYFSCFLFSNQETLSEYMKYVETGNQKNFLNERSIFQLVRGDYYRC